MHLDPLQLHAGKVLRWTQTQPLRRAFDVWDRSHRVATVRRSGLFGAVSGEIVAITENERFRFRGHANGEMRIVEGAASVGRFRFNAAGNGGELQLEGATYVYVTNIARSIASWQREGKTLVEYRQPAEWSRTRANAGAVTLVDARGDEPETLALVLFGIVVVTAQKIAAA